MDVEVRKAARMQDVRGDTTHFILDLRASKRIPEDAISNIRYYIKTAHPHAGRVAIVGGNQSHALRLLRNLFNIVDKIYDASWAVKFAATLEEARAWLTKHDRRETAL